MGKYEHCIIPFRLTRDLGLGPHCQEEGFQGLRDRGGVGWDGTGSTYRRSLGHTCPSLPDVCSVAHLL